MAVRVGVYADLTYRRDGGSISTDRAFILFVKRLAPSLGELVLFGRLAPGRGRAEYVIGDDGIRFVALPHYASLASVSAVARSIRSAVRAFARELDGLNAVWLFGPHPLALTFARVARRRGIPVFLGVRQDLPAYVRNQLPSRWWAWAIPVAHVLEFSFRAVSRTTPTVVVGEDLGRKYGRGGAPLLVAGFSLVTENELRPLGEALAQSWDGELRILTVGRLDAEKNPLLLPGILAELRRRDPRWRLAIAGVGGLRDAVLNRAHELGVADELELLGYVENGERLWSEYRGSHVFLHVSLTEGLPQVLVEAAAMGLPIVATDVGGVRAALGNGSRGLLVPPDDAAAAAAALGRLRDDAPLRRQLIERGLEHAATETLEAQLGRVADFFYANVGRARP